MYFPLLVFYKYFKVWLEKGGQVLQGFLVSTSSSSGLQCIYVSIFWRIHFTNCCGKALGGLLLTDSDHCHFNHLQITSRWVSVTQRWRIFITFINSARILQTYKCAMQWQARWGCGQGHIEHITQRVHSTCGQAGSPLLVSVSNAQVGCYLKGAKTQSTPANLILLRGATSLNTVTSCQFVCPLPPSNWSARLVLVSPITQHGMGCIHQSTQVTPRSVM